MNRRNYAGTSGVIIDLCRTDGIWFDADELARILVWIRAGGVERPKPEPKREDEEAEDGARTHWARDTGDIAARRGVLRRSALDLVRGAWRGGEHGGDCELDLVSNAPSRR